MVTSRVHIPEAAFVLLLASLLLPLLGATPTSAQVGNPSALAEDSCDDCHPFDRVEMKGKSHLGWNLNVWRMEAVHGCDIPEAEREVVLDYLAQNYPRREGAPSRDLAEYLFGAVLLLVALSAASLWISLRGRRET